jgi:hypothetical protein
VNDSSKSTLTTERKEMTSGNKRTKFAIASASALALVASMFAAASPAGQAMLGARKWFVRSKLRLQIPESMTKF